jgi:hypothetical protein
MDEQEWLKHDRKRLLTSKRSKLVVLSHSICLVWPIALYGKIAQDYRDIVYGTGEFE